MALKYNLIEVLERVANRTGPAIEPEKVVTMPGLDKIHKLIRELQGKLVVIDGDEHALHLALNEIERDAETRQADIAKRRAEVNEHIRQNQKTLIEAMKQCGIAATIPGESDADE